MANLKRIRKRISGVNSTQQITRAMKLVAAAKLRRAQETALASRPYTDALASVIAHLASLTGEPHPLLEKRAVKKVLLLVLSSDRGLCGSFNLNVCRAAEQFILKRREQGQEAALAVVGKKGNEYLARRNHPVVRFYKDMFMDISYDRISRIGAELVQEYVSGGFDALEIVYNWFKSPLVQKVRFAQVLPIEPGEAAVAGVEHLFEPDRKQLLDTVLPMFVNVQCYHALLESVASEMGARMTAMDNATNNARDLMQRLTLEYNKARQEAITKELMDIVGGSNAVS